MSQTGPIISVEDDEDDQYLIREAIEAMEIPNELRFFPNGQVALDYLISTPEKPFVILCDINMPLMDGFELRKQIISSEYLRRKAIPFVFLTTAASIDVINAAYDTAVQGFYQKPSQYAELQRQLRLIVDYWRSCLHPNSRQYHK